MAGAAKKFNLTELLNQRSKEAGEQQKTEQQQAAAGAEVVTSEEGVSSTADIYDLIPSKGNFYSVEDVQDLKQSIELLGVLQPLLVTDEEEDGKRRIIAGHRRRLAVMQLVDEGNLNQAEEKRHTGQIGTDYGKSFQRENRLGKNDRSAGNRKTGAGIKRKHEHSGQDP